MSADNRVLWLLYHPPKPKVVTGHVGLLVTNNSEGYVKAVFYYSLYHACLPSDIRKHGKPKLLQLSFPAMPVYSYEDDVIMRGQSWTRIEDHNQRENETVQDLIRTLPTDEQTRKAYFERGAYDYAIRLSSDIDIDVVIKKLLRTQEIGNWALQGPVTQNIFLDLTAYNCCSAIDIALEEGAKRPWQRGALGEMLAVGQVVTRLFYFVLLLSFSNPVAELSAQCSFLWFAPFLYMLINSLNNAYDFIFCNDFACTPLGKLEGKKLGAISAFFTMMNILFLPITSDATRAIAFPNNMARVATQYFGGRLFEARNANLPELSCGAVIPAKAEIH